MKVIYIVLLFISVTAWAIHGGQTMSTNNPLYKGLFLLKIENGDDGLEACTSFVIDEYYVLTAAHCVVGRTAFSLIRTNNYNRDFNRGGQFRKRIYVGENNIAVHPQYLIEYNSLTKQEKKSKILSQILSEQRFANYDIAVIKLKNKITDVEPILLPQEIDTNYTRTVQLNGYGIDILTGKSAGGLQSVLVDRVMSKTVNLSTFPMSTLSPNGDSISKGMCVGDSGGPATFTGGDGKNYVYCIQVVSGLDPSTKKECWGYGYLLKIKPVLGWIDGVRFTMR